MALAGHPVTKKTAFCLALGFIPTGGLLEVKSQAKGVFLLSEIRMKYLYTLKDPRSGRPRYVGYTQFPEIRLYNHVRDGHPSKRQKWLIELCEDGHVPEMEIVAQVDNSEADLAETNLIIKLLKAGENLTNVNKRTKFCKSYDSNEDPNYPKGVNRKKWRGFCTFMESNDVLNSHQVAVGINICTATVNHYFEIAQSLLGWQKTTVIVPPNSRPICAIRKPSENMKERFDGRPDVLKTAK